MRTALLALLVAIFSFGMAMANESNSDAFRELLNANQWNKDIQKAKKKAFNEGKDLLLFFTGSDWKPFCARMEKEVFSSPKFKREITKKYILVYIDFPAGYKQSITLENQNQKLLEEYKIDSFPTIALTDHEGTPYTYFGYTEGGVEGFFKSIDTAIATKKEMATLGRQANNLTGEKKTRAIDKIISIIIRAGAPLGIDGLLDKILNPKKKAACPKKKSPKKPPVYI